MWFHLFTGNHDELGTITIHDMMEWLIAGLTELKHEVTVGDTIAPNAINIIWENFCKPDLQIFDKHHFTFGLIATEIPTGGTFNWLEHDPWLTRRKCFDKIAPRAAFIWSTIAAPITRYREWAPAGFLEMGFSERLLDPVFLEEPVFDFGFYGLDISPYRRQLLERLKVRCTITVPDHPVKGRELNRFIASFKVGLCLKHLPNWPVSSPCRLSRLVHAKRGAAAEYVPIRTGPSAFVAMAHENQDFVSFCLECVQGPWKRRAEDAYERFRAAMPMNVIMERLLDETVSVAKPSMKPLAARDDGRRLISIFGGATTGDGKSDPAATHLASVPVDRIRRMTTELQESGGDPIDPTTTGLLNDYSAAVSHLRALATLVEQRLAAAAGPIQRASHLIQRTSKPVKNEPL
jgi:hypothetical protein